MGRRYHLKRDDLAEGGRRGRGSADLPGLRSRRRRKEVNSNAREVADLVEVEVFRFGGGGPMFGGPPASSLADYAPGPGLTSPAS